MAKINREIIEDTETRILEGQDLVDIRRHLRKNRGCSGEQVNKIVIAAKEAIKSRVTELKDILPQLIIYRLNDLYVTSVNASPRDRAAILKELGTLIGMYKDKMDVAVDFKFVIGGNDEVEPDSGEEEE